MEKIPFENGTKVADGYVEIDGINYNTIQPQYTGETPLNAENLNQMQDNIENAINDQTEHRYTYKVTSTVTANTEFTIPCKYKVRNKLFKCLLKRAKIIIKYRCSRSKWTL